ncbi:hypothetical protein [Streptomyces atratus]|uniref:hypothetical protein n=1 Tax=Streptomyces atratus TaxID=1893 RepID=UPI001E610D74|nr:hypothetical protein [Streptomyces atratus]
MLVLSELPTDAGQHARVSPGREIETRFRPMDEGARIEVHDASDLPPQVRDPEPGACGGRGAGAGGRAGGPQGVRGTVRAGKGRVGGVRLR